MELSNAYRKWGALALIFGAALACAGGAWWVRDSLGGMAWFFGAAAIMAMAGLAVLTGVGGTFGFRTPGGGRTRAEELDQWEERLRAEELRLEQRRRSMAEVLATHQEWLSDEPGATTEDPETTALMAEKDRRVMEFLRAEAERMFERIKANDYSPGGDPHWQLIGNDLGHVIEGVARIYQPQSQNPLMETSIEQLLRFTNRASLHLLVLLEGLPIDVKGYNLRETYSMVRKAMNYYGVYKRASKYWSYARPAVLLGRFALGANPLTLALTWGMTELATYGGKKLSTHYANQYGLQIFHESLRTLGAGAAEVYGGDFRHRDAAWIYGVELVEACRRLPDSGDALRRAVNEINTLPMRSEYDRIILLQRIGSRRSAAPERFRPRDFLSGTERLQVAQRLEAFLKAGPEAEGSAHKAIESWAAEASARLGLPIRFAGETDEDADRDHAVSELTRSLASFLIGIKETDPGEARDRLLAGRFAIAAGEVFSAALDTALAAPPMIFDLPEVTGAPAELADAFMEDMIRWESELPPHDGRGSAAVHDAAAVLRRDAKASARRLGIAYAEEGSSALRPDSPIRRLSPDLALWALGHFPESDRPAFAYRAPRILDCSGDHRPKTLPSKDLVLIGTIRERLLLVRPVAQGRAEVLWESDHQHCAVARRQKALLADDAILTGGRWFGAAPLPKGEADAQSGADALAIRVPGRPPARFHVYFEALLEVCREKDGESAPETESE